MLAIGYNSNTLARSLFSLSLRSRDWAPIAKEFFRRLVSEKIGNISKRVIEKIEESMRHTMGRCCEPVQNVVMDVS